MRTTAGMLCALLLAASSAGCAGYRLGNSLPGNMRLIHIPTFKNDTAEPLLEAETTRETMQAFQLDGSLKLADAAKADCRLDVVLTALTLDPVVYERNDAKVPEEYRLRIQTQVTLINSRTGEKILERQAKGERLFRPAGDLATAKRTAIPKASQDLARKIVRTVVEYW